MRIVVDLPDWCNERNIYIMAGIEMAAYKPANQDALFVKTVRCKQCGKCCMQLPSNFPMATTNGQCNFLHVSKKGDYTECKLKLFRPHMCSVSISRKSGKTPYCCIEYEERSLDGKHLLSTAP